MGTEAVLEVVLLTDRYFAFIVCTTGHARVTRIVIDEKAPLAAPAGNAGTH